MTPPARIFTLTEARRTLPLVRRIVGDLVETHRLWVSAVTTLDQAVAAGSAEDLVLEEQRQIMNLAQTIDGLLTELEQVGCYFKDFAEGLVDYPTLVAGRPALLCWKLGEPDIEYWHELDAGFSARQKLSTNLAMETVS